MPNAMDRTRCAALDAEDPLAPLRAQFALPDGVVYLDGNSLGVLPVATAARVQQVVTEEWGRDLIRSWNSAGWIEAPARVGGKVARLIGAQAHEVVVADSTSVNLFKLAAGALALRPGRTQIVTEAGNFPTDLYVLQGLQRLLPDRCEVVAVTPDDLLTKEEMGLPADISPGMRAVAIQVRADTA